MTGLVIISAWVVKFPERGITKVKMTQINFVSRNQLHNTANRCQHLNFGFELAWLGAKCKGKTLLVIEIFFALRKDCTVTV